MKPEERASAEAVYQEWLAKVMAAYASDQPVAEIATEYRLTADALAKLASREGVSRPKGTPRRSRKQTRESLQPRDEPPAIQ
ncbi:hypothetical protein [Nonomuraea roseola]|uniref:Uncharacterized protein n=1 Tax=Nonomuraea roseola TaxID=46179 RepID=A0ABV5QFQ4_9ACTN